MRESIRYVQGGNRRLIFVPVAVMLIVFALIGAVGQWQMGKILDSAHRETAVAKLVGLKDVLRHAGPLPRGEGLQRFAERQAESLKARVTLIDRSGVVLADTALSYPAVGGMDNHGKRPEVTEARARGLGIQRRRSDTLGMEMLYVAAPFESANTSGIVRISVSVDEVVREINRHRLTFILFVILGLAVAAGLGIAASVYFSRQLRAERGRLEERVAERTEAVYHLQNFGTLLNACKDTVEAKEIIERTAPDLLPETAGNLYIFKASKNALELSASWGEQAVVNEHFEPDECWALRTGRPYPADDKMVAKSCHHYDGADANHTLCVPMTAHGETIGVLCLTKRAASFTVGERQMAALMAEQISLAEANIKLRHSLREQAIRDPLTNLYNLRFLLETMEKEIRRAERHKYKFVVLMIDVDHFKKFNDTHGHDAGDLVLSKLGQLFNRAVRGHDVACRYGGEEFTLIMPQGDAALAIKTAERICQQVRDLEIPLGSTVLRSFSISIGGAVFPDHGKTPMELLKSADDALYLAKRNGRDRFELSGASETPVEQKSKIRIVAGGE